MRPTAKKIFAKSKLARRKKLKINRYGKMITSLKKKAKRKTKKVRGKDIWSLYILRCGDGSFYTGITNNLDKRFKAHQTGRGSHYTKTHLPVEKIYSESCGDRSAALIREYEIKKWPKKKKERFVAENI